MRRPQITHSAMVVIAAVLISVVGLVIAHTGHRSHPVSTQFPGHDVVVGGDVMLGRDIERKVLNGTSPFAQVRPLFEAADVVVVNLESPLTKSTDAQDKEILLRARPESAVLLHDAGVTVAALANNHIFDFGEAGVAETIAELDRVGIAHLGAGVDLATATRPLFVDIEGVKFAFVNFSQHNSRSVPAATPTSPGQAYFGSPAFADTVNYAAANSDFVIALLHFGEEYATDQTSEQQQVARTAIDLGADVVIGHHPHVTQGIEVYRGHAIFYSIGNLVFDQETVPWDRSFLVAIDLTPDGVHFTLYPYIITEGVPTMMTVEAAAKFLDGVNDMSPGAHVAVSDGVGTMSVPTTGVPQPPAATLSAPASSPDLTSATVHPAG